jgi:cell division protein FtsB
MKKFQKKNRWGRFVQSKPFSIFLFAVLILSAWNIFNLFGKWQDTNKNKNIEQEKIMDLERRKQNLSLDIEKLSTDRGKEEMIRENFGMTREGEEVIVIVDEKKSNNPEKDLKNKGFFSFFKNIFSR